MADFAVLTLHGRAQVAYRTAWREAVYLLFNNLGDDMPTKPVVETSAEESTEIAELFGTDLTVPQGESVHMDDPFKDAVSEPAEDIFGLLLQQPIDPEALARKEQALFLSTGTYVWDQGKCTVRKSFNDNDIVTTDLAQRAYAATKDVKYNHGRCYFRISGIVVNKDTGAKGRFDNWSLSPDERFRRDNQGRLIEPLEPDLFSKAYAMVTRFFFEKYDRKPLHDGEVLALLESGLYLMYITRGKNGNNYLNQLRELS